MSNFAAQMAIAELRRQLRLIDGTMARAALYDDRAVAAAALEERLTQVRAHLQTIANQLDSQS